VHVTMQQDRELQFISSVNSVSISVCLIQNSQFSVLVRLSGTYKRLHVIYCIGCCFVTLYVNQKVEWVSVLKGSVGVLHLKESCFWTLSIA
jgi:hypothetical protein